MLKELLDKSLDYLKNLCRQYGLQVKGRRKKAYVDSLLNNVYYCLESSILEGVDTCKGWYCILRMKAAPSFAEQAAQVEEYALKFNIVRRVTGLVKEHLTKFKSRVYRHMKWLANFNLPFTQYSHRVLGFCTTNIFDIETKGREVYNTVASMFNSVVEGIQAVGDFDDILSQEDVLDSLAMCDYSVHSWLVTLLDAGLFIATLLRQDAHRTNLSDFWNNQVQPALLHYNSTVPVS